MAVKLKNVSGEVVYLGRTDGLRIEDGQVVDVDGSISKDSPDDAYLIGDGDDARLWPKTRWTATGGKSAKSEGDES